MAAIHSVSCFLHIILTAWLVGELAVAAWVTPSAALTRRPWEFLPSTSPSPPSPSSSTLPIMMMGLWDGWANLFLKSRQNDFVKLDHDTDDVYGPGPLLILYHIPVTIEDDEIQDMLHDKAPKAFAKQVRLARLSSEEDGGNAKILDMSLQDALQTLMSLPLLNPDKQDEKPFSANITTKMTTTMTPVLLFSGFDNREMINVYNLLGQEIYQENGQAAACAKVVPRAMPKPLRQVLDEICGDHMDAMRMTSSRQVDEEEKEAIQ